ncbi:MAG TPA: RDD family protein [Kineosporiaceae bacterium]|nr:RDD family protein [Kineosporiaceae bacterium]
MTGERPQLALPPEVVTGEAVALELRPASFATRALAQTVDLLVMAAFGLVVGVALAQLPGLDEAASQAVALVAVVGVIVGLPVTVETLTRGRSLGKVAAGLRVVRDDGGPVRFRHALVRGLLAVVEILATLGSIALITSLLNSRGKRLGDLLAGTFVLRERGGSALAPLPPMPPELAGWALQTDLAQLPEPLAVGVRRFLGGAGSLHPGSRHQLGAELATEVARYVAPPPPPGTAPERFLVAVLVERGRRDLERLNRLEADRAARRGRRRAAGVLSAGSSRLLGDP